MFSWFPASSSKNNYEKILFDLENKINAQVDTLAQVQKQESFYHDSIQSLFKVYLLWMMGVIIYSSMYKLERFNVVVGIIVPLFLQGTRKIVEFFYSLQKRRLEGKLEKTRLYQLEKIEELKNKTAYYTTKGLIERYETPLKKNQSMADLRSATNPRPNSQMGTPPMGPLPPHMMPVGDLPLSPAGGPQLSNPMGMTPPVPMGGRSPRMEMNGIGEEDALDIRKSSSNSSMGVLMSPSKSWVDKLMDKIIGDPGQFSKYALICEFCYSHNGLVLPENFSKQQFRCFKCDKFNASQEDRLKNVPQKLTEKESPLRSYSGSSSSTSLSLADLANKSRDQASKLENASNGGTGKENSSTGNGIVEHESKKESNGTITPPKGGSDVEKKSSSKLKKRTNKKIS